MTPLYLFKAEIVPLCCTKEQLPRKSLGEQHPVTGTTKPKVVPGTLFQVSVNCVYSKRCKRSNFPPSFPQGAKMKNKGKSLKN